MAKKKVGIYLEESLSDRVDAAAALFDGQKSELVSAALLMFLDAPRETQRDALRAVMLDKVDRFFTEDPPDVRTGAEGPTRLIVREKGKPHRPSSASPGESGSKGKA